MHTFTLKGIIFSTHKTRLMVTKYYMIEKILNRKQNFIQVKMSIWSCKVTLGNIAQRIFIREPPISNLEYKNLNIHLTSARYINSYVLYFKECVNDNVDIGLFNHVFEKSVVAVDDRCNEHRQECQSQAGKDEVVLWL